MDDQRVVLRDLGEQVDVALDQRRFGDDAETVAGLAGEDFEQAPGDSRAALDGLVGIGCRAERDLVGGIDASQLLLQQPRGVLFEKDDALEGERDRAAP